MKNLNQEQFYHSSPINFKNGDIVKPIAAGGPDDERGEVAYSAEQPYHAESYLKAHPYANGPQGQLFGAVYKVEALDPDEELTRVHAFAGGSGEYKNVPSKEVQSKKGYRVTGVHSYVPYPQNTGSSTPLDTI
jgi:hypothetical protein